MRKTNTFLIAASLSFSFAAIAQGQTMPAQGNTPPNQAAGPQQSVQPPQSIVIASVNDSAITQQEVDTHLQPHLQANPQIDQQELMALREQVLQGLIESRLVEDYLLEEGPAVAEQEVENTVEQVKQQVQSQGADFKEFLATRGQTKQDMKKRIQGMLAWNKYQQEVITEPKLQEFHAQNRQVFGNQEYDQVRQEVAQSYTSGLWKALAERARPEAKVEVIGSNQLAPSRLPSLGQSPNEGATTSDSQPSVGSQPR